MVGGNQVDNHATLWSNLQDFKIPKLDRVWQLIILSFSYLDLGDRFTFYFLLHFLYEPV